MKRKKNRIKDEAQRVQLYAYLFGGFSQRICAASFKLNCTHVVHRVKMYFLMDCVLRYCSFHVQGVYTCVCAFLVASH